MTKKLTSTILSSLQQDYENDNCIEHNNYLGMFYDNLACERYIGIKSPTGPSYLKRYALPDFYYDLLVNLGTLEKELIDKNAITAPSNLYHTIEKKVSATALRKEYNYYTSLIYAEQNLAEHWNNSKLLTQEQKSHIIFKELPHNGIESYRLLDRIFSDRDFTNARKTELNVEYNILEYTLVNLLTQNDKVFMQNLGLYCELKKLNFTNDFSRVFKPATVSKIKLEYLQNLGDNGLESLPILFFSPNKSLKELTLLEATKLNHVTESLNNFFNCGSGKGLNHQNYNDLASLLTNFKTDNFLKEHLGTFIQAKAEGSIGKNLKTRWAYIYLQYTAEPSRKSSHKTKI